MNSIIDYLEHWAAIQPDKCFSSFLDVHGKEIETYTYSGFNERSRHLAEYLSSQVGLMRGDRVLLVYPPGLEVIVAFIACVRIGAIPVPVYPPTPANVKRGLSHLTFVARDCDARVALTTRELLRSYPGLSEEGRNSTLLQSIPVLPDLDWFSTDDVRGQASDGFYNDPGPILFLQYTSGSTSDPKGVIVSHENVIHNCRATVDHVPTAVCWLPQYHDMGLIGYYVYLVITGGTTYGFSPMDFLKRPVLWLQTLSRVRATYTSSPNFGFEYCLRADKIPSEQLSDLDLSSVRIMMSGAEPVVAETYQRFLERFGPCGLRPEASVVAYGLAENTLAVTNYGRRMLTVNKRFLQEGTLHIEHAEPLNNNQLTLVSCGRPLEGIHVRIVDPQSRVILGSKQIGEIWLAGKSTCQGYWNRPKLTHEVFHNAVANDPEDQNTYLRTGDLGFLEDGELFVCGRIKDLIIIRGVNYYPQDIERIVESTSQKIRTGSVAAFSGNEGEETLVIVVGVRTAKGLPDPAKISHALRTHYYAGPHTIVFAPPRMILKTTSGKIARSLIRQRWLNGELPVIATYVSGQDKEFTSTLPSGLRERFQYILGSYNLTGHEEYTLAEVGIDSLAMAMLLLEIEQMFEEHGITELVNVIDGRLLQRLTVAELFSLLGQLEQGSEEQIAALQLVLKQLKQEQDDYEADCMRQDAKLGSINCADIPENDEPLTSVLLTGPTGFFGPFLLSSLLLQTPYTYYVLTRAADHVSGMERIRDSLRGACLLTPALNEDLEKRVHIVCGDIAQHNLGMRSELWKSLTTRVQAVIHNAALVDYVLNYNALRPHNVDGTRELLRFACTGTKKEFHFISSTIIFGWTSKGELLESENNEDMLNLDFGYAQSKWVAEQLVFAAEKQGLNVRVYRPAFISASTNGIASKDDIVIRLLAFMINHGIAVNARNQISFLPADIAANNIAAIFKQRQTAGRTFHVTVDDYYNLLDITRLITEEYGYLFVYYDIPTFVAEMTRRCPKDDPLYPLLDFFNRSHSKIAAMQHKRYNNDRYREARQLSGNSYPDPTLQQTVSYLMSYMLREGIIPGSPRTVGK
jgi:thioester reductase-like protein